MTSYFSPFFLCAFLPLTVAVYGLVPQRARWGVLLVASYLFFACISSYLIVFILLSTLSVYGLGLWMGKAMDARDLALKEPGAVKKEIKAACKKKLNAIMALGLVFNFGLLIASKYLAFFADLALSFVGLLGVQAALEVPHWGVPIGMSFYTLMAASYLMDIVRSGLKPDKHLGHVALYLAFFPQIMEGPICRYTQTGALLAAGNPLTRSNLYAGTLRIMWGLAKKMIVADRLNLFVKTIYDGTTDFADGAAFDGGIIAVAAILYTVQLYCDFSGTMDMAVGMGRLFGISITENFRQPFFSRTASEFWQRWHITLGAWLRDYIYYPISLSKPMKKLTSALRKKMGNRYGPLVASSVALFAVWLGNGLWHGAGTQYLFFGMYYFVLIVAGGFLEPAMQKFAQKTGLNRDSKGYHVFQIARTWVIIFVGEMFFRANGMEAGFAMFAQLVGNFSLETILSPAFWGLGMDAKDLLIITCMVTAMFVVGALKERGVAVLNVIAEKPAWVRWGLVLLLFTCMLIFGAYGGDYEPVEPMYAEF